jgi:hypothetical protein
MAVQRIWILNFDADDELAHPVGYTPAASVLTRFASLSTRLSGLVPPDDDVIPVSSNERRPTKARREGRAFCPTPRALRELDRAGAILPEAPPLDVLRRVNHRAFCADIGQFLPGARYVRSRDELLETLAAATGPWVMKRAFGFAGRGRQRLRSNHLDASVEPFVRVALESGEGLEVEPWVRRVIDVGLHGFISRAGTVTMGDPTRQDTDDTGAWVRSAPLVGGVLTPAEEDAFSEAGESAGDALARAGYFGPFGIDGFRWKDEHGTIRFNPRSEINARYSMGWAVGMGTRRPDLEVSAS